MVRFDLKKMAGYLMESFQVEMGLLGILASFVVFNENYVGLQVMEHKKSMLDGSCNSRR